MSVRNVIADRAIWEADGGDWKPSGDEMIQFFQQSGLKSPTPADLQKFSSMQSNVLVEGKSIAWCGIFACYVLKRWGGLNVSWVSGTGIVGGGILKKQWDWRHMRVGDVAVVRNSAYVRDGKTQYMHHHYIITAVDYKNNLHSFVEGNGMNNKIWWRQDRPINQSPASLNDLKRPYCNYQLNA